MNILYNNMWLRQARMKVSTVYTNLHCKNLISNFNVSLALSHIVSEIYTYIKKNVNTLFYKPFQTSCPY